MKRKYLIVKCTPLNDQWECDADRTPITIVENISRYQNSYGYEIYEIKGSSLVCIKEWEDGH